MDEITIKVYNDDFVTVKKEIKAEFVKVPFGFVRKLMRLCNIENINSTKDLLGVLAGSWDSVTKLLDNIFPEMSEDDWDGVDTKEILSVVFSLVRRSVSELKNIPTDPKN